MKLRVSLFINGHHLESVDVEVPDKRAPMAGHDLVAVLVPEGAKDDQLPYFAAHAKLERR